MSWGNQGGGGGGPWGGGQSPWGRGPRQPNLEEILRRSQARVRRLLPGGSNRAPIFALLLGAVLLIWGITGFFRVQPDELGVVLRFGAYNRTVTPGLNYHLPYPVEYALTPKVTRINTIEIGGTPRDLGGRSPTPGELTESRMLTGDENLVDVYFTVQWQIRDPQKYLFNIREPEETVKAVAESSMREVIGRTPAVDAIVGDKNTMASETRGLVQKILDSYDSGILINAVLISHRIDFPSQDVQDAFIDVQSAKTDRDSAVIRAQQYLNSIVPRAKGEAAQVTQQAEAYRQQIVRQAEGDASRFLAVYQAYKQAEDVTARRLYIETMEKILSGANKIVLDKAATASGVLPYLPLPELRNPKAAPSTSQTPPTTPSGSSQTQQR
jgi:modulator of FtsH protease HflK